MIHSLLSKVNEHVSKNKLHIFIYHQILNEFDPMRPDESTAERFDWQMALVKRHFTPLTLSDAVVRLKNGTLPPNAVCITFDDGYLNNLTVAQPILEKYQIPATIYIATAFSEGLNMWNDRVLYLFSQTLCDEINISPEGKSLKLEEWGSRRANAYETLVKLKYLEPKQRLEKVNQLYLINPAIDEQEKLMMTPKQVATISKSGFEIGAHTHTHPILSVLDIDEQRNEILRSKQLLEEWTGQAVKHFAYPNGIWEKDLDHKTVSIVEELGFESAVITNWGMATRDTSNYLLPRFTPWDRTRLAFHTRIVRDNFLSKKA